jgi:hypothetical protein
MELIHFALQNTKGGAKLGTSFFVYPFSPGDTPSSYPVTSGKLQVYRRLYSARIEMRKR